MARLMPPSVYHDYDYRLESFSETFLTNDYKKNLAKFGIYYEPGIGMYKCAFCSMYMYKLNMRTLKYHTYSICPIVTSVLKTNESMRRESFKKFKTGRKAYGGDLANKLAVNGFYFYGKNIEIRCASCLLTIVKLNKADTADLIHQRYSPDCVFNNKPSAPPISESDSDNAASSRHTDKRPVGPIVMPHHRLYPSLSSDSELSDNEPDNGSMDDEICKNKIEKNAANMSLVANDKTNDPNDDRLCKICFEQEKNTCFLPCKHLSTCRDCAKKCKLCCICRVKVKERLEVYLQ